MDAMREQFLAGCDVVLSAITDERVIAEWSQPSALADQTVGSLASHVAFACWMVTDALDYGTPDEPVAFETAAEFYAIAIELLTDEVNQGIHDRSATDAANGPTAVGENLRAALPVLRERLASEPENRLVHVFGGVMRLDDWLWTRVVEQVVHLDDLARSLNIEPWENPPDAEALVIACGAEIGRQRRGSAAMIRALFRDSDATSDGVLPVI